METEYTLKNLMEIIFQSTNKNACILADSYLLRDISVISRWRNGKTLPKYDDILKVVEFSENESTVAQKMIMRTRIESLLSSSFISEDIKKTVIKNEEFSDFMREALSISISSQTTPKLKGIRKVLSDKVIEEKDRFVGSLDFDVSIDKDGNVRPNRPIKLHHRLIGRYGKVFPKSTALSFIFLILITAFLIYTFENNQNIRTNITVQATPRPQNQNNLILANIPEATESCSPSFSTPTPNQESDNHSQKPIIKTQNTDQNKVDGEIRIKDDTKSKVKDDTKVKNNTKSKIVTKSKIENKTEVSNKETHNIEGDKNVVIDETSNSSISININ